jgi:diguanylate cyclase (GGDEF)-like protein
MDFLETFQLNLYTLAMLAILTVIITKRLCIETYGKRLLLTTIFLTFIALINEPLAWEMDGSPTTFGYIIEYGTNMLEKLLSPLIIALMLQYVRYTINRDRKPFIQLFGTFPPVIFTVIMLLINLFVPVYFSVDPITHYYSVGSLVFLHYLMISLSYVYMVYYVYKYRHLLKKHQLGIFYIFFLLPILGMYVQLLNNRIFVSWTSIALSILVVYVFLESTDGERDHMTNLFNRRSYETYITQRMEQLKPFKIIYIDLDRFKSINDLYGHVAGDHVLITFAALLNEVFDTQLCARLGGDEFMVVSDVEVDIESRLSTLRERISESTQEIIKDIQFSYGVQQDEPGVTIDELYNLVDKKMYEYKRQNKTLKRRKTD